MIYRLELLIHGLPPTTNGSHGHWRKAYGTKQKWKKATAFAIAKQGKPKAPLLKAHCTFVRVSTTEPDYDNLVISFKAVRDALVECGVLANDKPSNMPDVKYLWEKGKPKQGYIKVIVKEIKTKGVISE